MLSNVKCGSTILSKKKGNNNTPKQALIDLLAEDCECSIQIGEISLQTGNTLNHAKKRDQLIGY